MNAKEKSKPLATSPGICSCVQGPELIERIFLLLLRATQNASLARTLLDQINNITQQSLNSHMPNLIVDWNIKLEQQIKQILEASLDPEVLGEVENERLRESRLAIVELMARSHAIAKSGGE